MDIRYECIAIVLPQWNLSRRYGSSRSSSKSKALHPAMRPFVLGRPIAHLLSRRTSAFAHDRVSPNNRPTLHTRAMGPCGQRQIS